MQTLESHLGLAAKISLFAAAIWIGSASLGRGAAVDQLPIGYVTELDPADIRVMISDGPNWKPVGIGTYIAPERTLSIMEWCQKNSSGRVRVVATPREITITCGNPTYIFRRGDAGSIPVPQLWWDIFNRKNITRPTITSHLRTRPGCIGVYGSDFAGLAPLDENFAKTVKNSDHQQLWTDHKVRELIANRVLDATASDLPRQPVNTNFSTSYMQTIASTVDDAQVTELKQKNTWYTPSPGAFDAELKGTFLGKTVTGPPVKPVSPKEWPIDQFGISPNPFNNLFGTLGRDFPMQRTGSDTPAKSDLDDVAAKLRSVLSSVQDQYRWTEQVIEAGSRDALIIPDDALDGPSWTEIRDANRRVVAVVATYGGFPVFQKVHLERGKYLVAVHRSGGTRLWQLSAVPPAEIPPAPTPSPDTSLSSTAAGALLAVRDDKRFLVEGLSRGYQGLDANFYGALLFDLSVVNVCSTVR